jgi:redox-sensing transcriptional repressor
MVFFAGIRREVQGQMSNAQRIPDIVIGRLPIYLRALNRMIQEDKEYTSSHELGERLGISSAQIRKDLSHFGEFGKQGTGYNLTYLYEQLRQILQVDREWPIAVVGVGDLGHAIANYRGFAARGFRVACLFDSDPDKIGESAGALTVLPMDQIVSEIRRLNVRVAMIAVPAEAAQYVANQLVQAGVRAILNYAPITLAVPPDVRVQYIDPVAHLQHMTYYLR